MALLGKRKESSPHQVERAFDPWDRADPDDITGARNDDIKVLVKGPNCVFGRYFLVTIGISIHERCVGFIDALAEGEAIDHH